MKRLTGDFSLKFISVLFFIGALYLQVLCLDLFKNASYIKFVRLHAISCLLLWISILVLSKGRLKAVRAIFVTGAVLWMTAPGVGPVMSILTVLICQNFSSNMSDLGDFLFNNVHAAKDLSFHDRFYALLKKMNLLTLPSEAALTILDTGSSAKKFQMMNRIEKLADESSSRIFRLALRDSDYDVQMFAAKKLSASEESFLEEMRNLIRRIELLPDQIDLRVELLRQSIMFHNTRICAESVTKLWLEKAMDFAGPIEGQLQDSSSLILFGRVSMVLGQYDKAKKAFESAARISSSDGVATFYLAELYFLMRRYGLTKQIMFDLQSTAGKPRIMLDRVAYWVGSK